MHNPFADVDSITSGWRVTYVYVDEMPAIAAASDEDGVRMILINRGDLEKIKDEVLRTTIERGARVHEGAEIVYGEIPKRNQAQKDRKSQGLNTTFWHTLDNILGDVYIEARIEKQFPVFAKYLSFLLWHAQELTIQGQALKLQPKSDIDKQIDEMLKKLGIQVNPALIKTLEAFWHAVRLGEVPKNMLDENVLTDLQFIVPRVFLARRGKAIDGVIQGSDEIYHYLDKKYGVPPEITIEIKANLKGCGSGSGGSEGSGQGLKLKGKFGSSGSSKEGGDDDKDNDQGAGGGKGKDKDKDKDKDKSSNGVNVLPWKSKEQVEQDAQDAKDETAEKLDQAKRQGDVGGLLGGPDHARLTPPTLKDAQFYAATIKKHEDTIRRLQALFKSLAGKRGFVPTREGDLILHPSILQAAYTDSFKAIGEDERDYYQVLRYNIPDIDLVMVIDQSGSTYGTAEVFSEAIICIIEAVRRVGKIRSAAVGLGDGLRILKDFWEPVEAGRFAPQSGGGTPLGEALDQALKFKWRRGSTVRRVVVILTDGYPDDWRKVDRPIAEVKLMHIIPIAFCVGVDANEDFRKRFEEVFEIKDADGLTEAFLKTFLEKAVLKIGRRR